MRYFYMDKDNWVPGVSDGLALPCCICGMENLKFDYIIDDEVWVKIVPKQLQPGVICLPCIDKLALDKGIKLGRYIKSLQYTGLTATVEFVPANIFYRS